MKSIFFTRSIVSVFVISSLLQSAGAGALSGPAWEAVNQLIGLERKARAVMKDVNAGGTTDGPLVYGSDSMRRSEFIEVLESAERGVLGKTEAGLAAAKRALRRGGVPIALAIATGAAILMSNSGKAQATEKAAPGVNEETFVKRVGLPESPSESKMDLPQYMSSVAN